MKWIYSADWHLKFKNPRIRTDDYTMTQYNKAKFICDLANKKKASLLIAGDIFDKPSCPLGWLYTYMNLFQSVKKGVYVIYGQHDIHFHNPDLSRTPIGVLMLSGALKHASQIMDVCNFGETIPERNNKTLCIHVPITQYEPPFYMEDAISAKDFMEQNPEWEFIVSGDFHEQHVTETDNQILFNPGPITRADKSKIDFKPKVIFHDTVEDEWEWIDIPIEKDVFNFDLMEKDDRTVYKDKIREFANSIDTGSAKQNFRENVRLVMRQMKLSKKALKILDEVIG